MQIEALEIDRARTEAEARPSPGHDLAVEAVRVGGAAWFWLQPAAAQNQLLAALLGDRRLIVESGRIVDVR